MAILAALRADPMKFLRNVLRANAAFSIFSGVLMIVGGASLGAWLGKPASVAPDGIVLLVFAAVILWITRKEAVSLKAAAVIVAFDAIYVVDTARLILGGQFSTAGNWYYGVAAIVVLDFAVLQLFGLLKATNAGNNGTQAAIS